MLYVVFNIHCKVLWFLDFFCNCWNAATTTNVPVMIMMMMSPFAQCTGCGFKLPRDTTCKNGSLYISVIAIFV